MKKMNETGSKAGIGTNGKTGRVISLISKSAYLLLMVMFSFSSMSFVQNNAIMNTGDTNQSLTKAKQVVSEAEEPVSASCCVFVAGNPGKGFSNAGYISLPGKKAIYRADKETIVGFINDIKERRIWSLDREAAADAADKTMHQHFMLSLIYPSESMVLKADAEARKNFAGAMVKVTYLFNTAEAQAADHEMADHFVADNLKFRMTLPAVSEMKKADTAMTRAFEEMNKPVIALPSAEAVKAADEAMVQRYGVSAK